METFVRHQEPKEALKIGIAFNGTEFLSIKMEKWGKLPQEYDKFIREGCEIERVVYLIPVKTLLDIFSFVEKHKDKIIHAEWLVYDESLVPYVHPVYNRNNYNK